MNRGIHLSKEHREKIGRANKLKFSSEKYKKLFSKIHKGKKLSGEHKKKLSKSKIGNKNWLGKHHTIKSKLKMSKAKSGKNHPMFGKTFSKERCEKISKARIGFKFTKESKEKLRISHLNPSKETKKKMSESHKGKHLPKEQIKKMLRRRPMSSLEVKMNEIILQNNLPYKFVGNGEFFIERKCPDFVNCNGEKRAVEVYYRRHKETFRKGLENWKKERSEIFAKYGWSLLYFDETEVNEQNVLSVLGKG